MEQSPMLSASAMNEEKPLDIKKLILVLLKYKWRIMFFAGLITSIAVAVVLSKPSLYTASATLMIEPKDSKVLSGEQVFGINTRSSEYLLTQFEILKSDSISLQVIERLDLVNHPEFNPALDESNSSDLKDFFKMFINVRDWIPFLAEAEPEVEPTEEQKRYTTERIVLAAFKAKLSISPKRKTQLVTIRFSSESPNLAARVANTVGTVYIENNLNAKFQMSKQASEWLGVRMQELKDKLVVSETELQEFVRTEGLVETGGKAGVSELAQRELNELTTQLTDARNRRVAAASLYNLSTTSEKDIAIIQSIPEITNHPLIRDLKLAEGQAERTVTELSQRYGPKHPRLQAARSDLQNISRTLNQELNELVRGIKNELASARAAEATIKREIQAKKNEYRDLSVKRAKYNELAREVESNQQLYDLFMSRYKETTASGDFGATIANFTDRATAPLLPSSPKRKLIVMTVFGGALAIGCVLALVFDAFNDSFNGVKQIEEGLALSLLGVLPRVKLKKGKAPAYMYFDDKERTFSEGIRTVRTGYMLSNINNQGKVVIVTSSVPAEGKSTCSISLAFALAPLEKTLLIDGDLRRPSIGNKFEFSGYQPGLANLISGTHELKDCIVKDRRAGLDIMPAGLIPPNPLDMIFSERFKEVLAMLRDQYDRIVIDTAPCQAVSDTFVLSQFADSCILVVKANATRTGAVKSTVGKLVQQGVKIDGVILNGLDVKKANKYGDYQTYAEYYTDGSERKGGLEKVA
ncbi:GumC family protein [Paraferrimonas sedimenticola]|uniref:non-specific protein-tyrosine kinase n=1 Tax=Paraferrimonas sedimenticola TaxID=375674 RepID=A0AA37RW02_9GAMM|nr:polysaccharide biosynthesis tyrosine autokinase [Paraferrimonas sedimenticola]GLP96018.1 chain-length determining protein [Paraferrimonas sedimenticola]